MTQILKVIPFYLLYDGDTCITHLQVVKNTLNPVWPMFQTSSQTLCNSDPDRNIKVDFTYKTVHQCFVSGKGGGE